MSTQNSGEMPEELLGQEDMDIQNLGGIPEEFLEQEDGSVLIPGMEPDVQESVFDENLAETLPASVIRNMAMEFCELVEKDKESRKRRDEQYEEGLRRTGLGDDAPGGAEFSGASKVVHPVLAEACIDFSSRAIKELFPAQGPVKSYTVGETSPEKIERSGRKTRFMNWQLTTQMQEYRAELEQLLTQLPMGGSQYQKFWYDERLRRPAVEFVAVDEVLLPFACTNFYTSPRVTHRQQITKYEFQRRVKSGLYRDIFDPVSSTVPESTLSGTANDKIEGREDDGYNEDGLRAILEIYTDFEFEGDQLADGTAPYIITIDEDTEEVLAIYRNWMEGDINLVKLDWFVEWKFIPWRGAYGIGLPHLIGGLSAALTGSLRALLDSAHINNAPTMLKLRSGRVVGQNTQVNVTQVCDIEGPANIDDIRKLAMPMPFNPPSPVLAGLMDKLYALAKGVVSTADDQLANVGDRTPVGTTMSLIEQGSVIYSAVHARLHESQKRALQILQRLDLVYLPDQDLTSLGGQVIEQEDFVNTLDVIPVSDPTIFSESQRFAQVQSLIQMSADQSVQWNKVELYRRAMRQMRIEAIDAILPAPPEPLTADAATENAGATQEGKQLKAVQGQDHMTHIHSHIAAVAVPWMMGNPLVPPQVVKAVLAHVNEHIQMLVTNAVNSTAQQILQAAQMQMQQISPEQATLMAQQQTMQMLGPQLEQIMQQIGQVDQVVSQRTPPPAMPPEVQASIQIAQMEIQRKTQADQAKMQADQAKMQADQQADHAKLQMSQMDAQFQQQLAMQKQQADAAVAQAKIAAADQAAQLKAQIDMLKNEQDNHQKQVTELLKNRDDNETAMDIALKRIQADFEKQNMQLAAKQADNTKEITRHMQELQKTLSSVLQEKLGDAAGEAVVVIESKEI